MIVSTCCYTMTYKFYWRVAIPYTQYLPEEWRFRLLWNCKVPY
jgi:hypothetical protein